jgi:hypothetical protein
MSGLAMVTDSVSVSPVSSRQQSGCPRSTWIAPCVKRVGLVGVSDGPLLVLGSWSIFSDVISNYLGRTMKIIAIGHIFLSNYKLSGFLKYNQVNSYGFFFPEISSNSFFSSLQGISNLPIPPSQFHRFYIFNPIFSWVYQHLFFPLACIS